MLTRKPAMLAFLILGLAIAVFFLVLGPSKRAPNVSVTFSGYTDPPTGGHFATFRVTNRGTDTLWHWASYWVEVRTKPGQVVRSGFSGANGRMAPAESVVYTVPAYAKDTDWRAVFSFSAFEPHLRLTMWAEGLSPQFRRFVPDAILQKNFKPWIIESEWIHN
jgi:hypothetical protein